MILDDYVARVCVAVAVSVDRHRLATACRPTSVVLPQVVANNLRADGVMLVAGLPYEGDCDVAILSFDDLDGGDDGGRTS